MELFAFFKMQGSLTLEEALAFVWRHHMGFLPSARPFNSNRKALCKTTGHVYLHELTEPDMNRHLAYRKARKIGNQTLLHDIKLVTLTLNLHRRWKRLQYVLDGFPMVDLRLPIESPVAYIKRPRTKPRKRPVSPNLFSRWIEHCIERLKRRSYFALDTGLSPCELERLEPRHYNATTDCLDLQRGKGGTNGSIPVSDRCRSIILEAVRDGRKRILDFKNHQKDIESTRRRSKVYFWFGRDLRTTYYNEILKGTNRNYPAAQRAMLHKDPRTGVMHYEVDDGQDLRPAILEMEKKFS